MTQTSRTPISMLMERHVCSVGMDDNVEAVEALFAQRRLTWAPVIDPDDGIVGVIASADLLQFRAGNAAVGSVPAWRLCTYKPITVSGDTTVQAVAKLMLDRKIHHVVVTEHGAVAGVVSSLDLLQAYAGAAARPEE